MAPLDLPYKTTFAAQIRTIEPSDNDLHEAKASLNDLKGLLPAGVNPDDSPQLLYIAANLYVAGVVNRNDDGVDIETSLAAYKGFEKQQLNIEHDRGRIAGYIIHAGLSEFGTDRVITDDEARAAGKPFNIAIVAALWKVVNPELCAFLSEASNPLHSDYKALSLSFEVGFSSYNIGVMDSADRVIADAKRVIRPEDVEFAALNKCLRSYGGSGKISADSTEGVYQILTGSIIPLGGGIVSMPAAAVKGITVITEAFEAQPDENANPVDNDKGEETEAKKLKPKEPDPIEEEDEESDEEESEDKKTNDEREDTDQEFGKIRAELRRLLAYLNISVFSRRIETKSRVSPIKPPINQSNMKSIKDIQEKVASAQKLEDYQQVVAGILEIAQAIEEASVKMSDELKAEKARGAQIEAAKAEAYAANEKLKADLDLVKAELDTVRANQRAAEADALFNERMAAVDDKFELTDEDRGYVAEEIKDLDQEAFAKWLDKNIKSIRKEKTKEAKAAKQRELEEIRASRKEASQPDPDAISREAFASAKDNPVSDAIPNNIDVSSKSLREQMAAEFSENVTIGGKKLSEYNKKD
jgi:hypothetical protein